MDLDTLKKGNFASPRLNDIGYEKGAPWKEEDAKSNGSGDVCGRWEKRAFMKRKKYEPGSNRPIKLTKKSGKNQGKGERGQVQDRD